MWFTEEDGPNLRISYKIEALLHRSRSSFQSIEVIESTVYGKILILDGFVMLSESDEFVYHEMIAHIPLCLHDRPERVLVIGGGDGGTVREVLKHPSVTQVTLCEIDGKVIEVCQEFFPQLTSGFADKRCEVIVGDGIRYIQEQAQSFDVIIIDSTDPVGPGIGLFTGDFYKSVSRALKPCGIMVAQSESPWYKGEVLRNIFENIKVAFPHVRPYLGSIPTYSRGLWSWTLASQAPIDSREISVARIERIEGLKYLTKEIAKASFALPPFYTKKIGSF
jgi:spermidine synthase